MEEKTMVPLGQVVGAHGTHGLVKIFFYSGNAPDLVGDRPVLRLRRAPAGAIPYRVVNISAHQRHFIVQLDEVGDRSAAESLVGAEVVVDREQLPAPGPDDYYWIDLIGLAVTTVDGQSLGTLAHIMETGSNDVYVVRSGRREVLVPALASVVRRIDLVQRQMWVDLPEGL